MISALLFDFGGTLDGPAHWLDRFLAQYRAAGLELSREGLDPAYDHATRTAYRVGGTIRSFSLRDLVRFLVGQQSEHLLRDGPAPIRAAIAAMGARGRHRLVETVTESFAAETLRGLEHNRAVLEHLRPHFQIAIVSNFYGNLERILAEARLAKLVDAAIDSSRVGVFKPDPGIFEAALGALKVKADASAMVGDSLSKDCAPARRLGLTAVWYHPPGSNGETPLGEVHAHADYTIATLEEIAEIAWR
jgi:HAD superfamily hydrolase (TIGR01549 family)